MAQKEPIQLFQDKQVRTVWDEAREEWYFSVVDRTARDDFERRLGHSVITSERAIEHTAPADQLPFNDKDNPDDEFFQLPGDLEE